MDHFKALAGLGLGSRLKRLSDLYMSEVKLLYTEQKLEFEPRWFPLFSYLYQNDQTTVTSAARELSLAHPYISQVAKEMASVGLIACKHNPRDDRSRTLSLPDKGRKLGRDLPPLWASIQKAVHEIVESADPGFFTTMQKMEQLLAEKPLSQRVREIKERRPSKNCRVLDYEPKLKPYFASLNREWIEKHFALEDVDHHLFSNPEKEILNRGGDIVFAEMDGEIVGTCALLVEDGTFELARLAVSGRAKVR